MNTQITQILGEIMNHFGAEALEDPKHFAVILQDYCKEEYKRERMALLDALEESIPNNLLNPSKSMDVELLIDQQIHRLLDNRMLSEDHARDIVETWALALGVLDTPVYHPQMIAQPSREETPATEIRPQQTGNDLSIELAPGVEMAFICVPAGEFLMGSDEKNDSEAEDDELPQHKVYLDEYLIGKYPVTNGQYAAFVNETGQSAPSDWERGAFPKEKEHHPVVRVSWEDAVEFCGWASKTSGKTIRLPSEAEWEKAARGTDERIYPWGNQKPESSLCNFNIEIGDTTAVGRYSQKGDSPYGCADMAGNVWEWVNDWYDAKYYENSPQKNPRGASDGRSRVLRGGSWLYVSRVVRVSNRVRVYPDLKYNGCGFRCVR